VKLQKLQLTNFRNYPKASFDLTQQTLIIGENGAGKSNILEAIYLLATGKSFRAERDNEMVAYGQEFARVSGVTDETELTVILNDRKGFEVNSVPKRMMDFVGKFRAVLFSPQDIELVTGNPSGRRRYLDFVISQKDREYHRCLISYEKGLRQRNKLLDMLREGLADRNQLFFWDRLLIKNGDYLTQCRSAYLESLNSGKYTATYDSSIISESRLKQYKKEEVAAAATLVGPHRDDFVVNLEGKDVSKFGSRGEQRMAVLWLKQGELSYLDSDTKPALLLDDIFSELDHQHRAEVAKLAQSHAVSGQVIMTTTDPHLLPDLPSAEQVEL